MLEIVRLPSYNFNSKCGEIHSYNAMIFSITCNFCGLIANSFEQFCLHFKEYHFEPADTDSMPNGTPIDNSDVEDFKSKISNFESSDDNEEFICLKDEVELENFELIKLESNTNYDLPEEEILFSPKQMSRSVDLEFSNEIEVERNELSLEHTIVEEEKTQAKTLAQQEDNMDKVTIIKKKRKSKYICKKKNKPTIRIFDCKHCGRSFNNKSNRNVHELRHKDIGDFHCSLCTKSFYTKMELIKHMRCHNDERPYVCEQCGRAFRHIWVLKKHSLTHSIQVRTLPCPTCGKLFCSKDNLRLHILTHNTIPMFACENCDKVFTQRKRLSAHKRRHHIKS